MNTSSAQAASHDLSCMIKEVTIQNRNGLHARPAALFVKTASRFRAEISVEKEGEYINGKSIMGLMMLAASQGSQLRLIAKGEESVAAIEALEKLIASCFGEDE